MTPERRQFVTKLISKIGSSLCCDQIDSVALSELGVAMCDIAEDNDSLTAEIATLKAALSGRTVSCELCNTTSKEIERLKAEVERLKQYNQECHRDLEAADKDSTELRTHLKAVHAGRGSQCYDESEMYAEQEGRGNDIPQ